MEIQNEIEDVLLWVSSVCMYVSMLCVWSMAKTTETETGPDVTIYR